MKSLQRIPALQDMLKLVSSSQSQVAALGIWVDTATRMRFFFCSGVSPAGASVKNSVWRFSQSSCSLSVKRLAYDVLFLR